MSSSRWIFRHPTIWWAATLLRSLWKWIRYCVRGERCGKSAWSSALSGSTERPVEQPSGRPCRHSWRHSSRALTAAVPVLWRLHSCANATYVSPDRTICGPPGPGGPLGTTPSSALARWHQLDSIGEERVQGDPRGPGGPPHDLCRIPNVGKSE